MSSPLYNIAFMASGAFRDPGRGVLEAGIRRRIATIGAAAALVRIVGFGVQSACDDNAWMNILQYVIPLAATAVALRSIFRQRVSRFIDMRRRPARIAPVSA